MAEPLEKSVAFLEAENARLRSALREAGADVGDLRAQNAELKRIAEEANLRADSAFGQLQIVRGSWAWKLSMPARLLMAKILG